MESNEISVEELKNFEDYGMKQDFIPKYQNTEGFDKSLMIEVGHYDSQLRVSDNDEDWIKVMLIGEDIGDGEIYFFINCDKLYLDKGNKMLDNEYRELFSVIMSQFFGPDVFNEIDFAGLN